MLQTHEDFDQAESERLAHAIEQIDITQRRNERLERENERLKILHHKTAASLTKARKRIKDIKRVVNEGS